MRYFCYTMGDPSAPEPQPSPELYQKMGAFVEEATKAGVLLATGGMAPLDQAVKLTLHDGEFTVLDGPFTEAKELVAGFWIWECGSREEAIEWLKRAPFDGGTEIELRPIFEADDFAEQLTPELRDANDRLREQVPGVSQ